MTSEHHWSRRVFLKTSAALALKAALPASGQNGSPGEGRKVKIGFFGAAHSHAREKIRLASSHPRLSLTGVFEPDAGVRSALAAQNIPWRSEQEVLEASELIAVESAVKDLSSFALRALAAGKHVHLEKPGAATISAFQALVKTARSHRRQLQVGYMWRFNPGFQKALEAARAGWLGEIFLVRGTMNTLLDPAKRPEWGEFPGGALFEQGCHLIDPIVRLLGRPASITSFLKTHGSDKNDLADNALAVLEYARATATVTNSTLQPNAFAHRSFEIFGSNGTAILKPIEQPVLQLDLAKPAGPYQAGPQQVPLPAYSRYRGEFDELADLILNGKEPGVTLDDELAVHETLLKACRM